MPKYPKHPCSYQGCPNLTYEKYCDKHKQMMGNEYEKYGRDKTCKKKYGRTWSKIRKRYVSSHPYCEECFKKGIITPVCEVHHIIPLSEGGSSDDGNLISLCKSCHAKVHGTRGDYQDAKKLRVYKY